MTHSDSQVILRNSSPDIDQCIVDSFEYAELYYEQCNLIVCEKKVILDYIAEIKDILLSFEESNFH